MNNVKKKNWLVFKPEDTVRGVDQSIEPFPFEPRSIEPSVKWAFGQLNLRSFEPKFLSKTKINKNNNLYGLKLILVWHEIQAGQMLIEPRLSEPPPKKRSPDLFWLMFSKYCFNYSSMAKYNLFHISLQLKCWSIKT